MDPELVEQVQLNVNGEDGGRRHQSQRQVENLKKKKKIKCNSSDATHRWEHDRAETRVASALAFAHRHLGGHRGRGGSRISKANEGKSVFSSAKSLFLSSMKASLRETFGDLLRFSYFNFISKCI